MQTRSEFLAATSALAALMPNAAATPDAAETPAPLPSGFEMRGFEAMLDTPARHKHLFACIKDADLALTQMHTTLNGYRDVGVPASQVHVAAVFYHNRSVLCAFDDVAWKRYIIPSKVIDSNDASNSSNATNSNNDLLVGNPVLSAMKSLAADAGARFFACNLATHGYAGRIAKALHLKEEVVYADLAAHLAPNAMLVPAGVWAIHAIQQHGYTLLLSS